MPKRYGKFYADWRDEHSHRHMKACPSAKTAKKLTVKVRGMVGSAVNGRPLGKVTMRKAWRGLTRKCGLQLIKPHDLRRTVATNLYLATKDRRFVQQYLGHKTRAATIHYLAPLNDEKLREHHELLNFHRFNSEVKQ